MVAQIDLSADVDVEVGDDKRQSVDPEPVVKKFLKENASYTVSTEDNSYKSIFLPDIDEEARSKKYEEACRGRIMGWNVFFISFLTVALTEFIMTVLQLFEPVRFISAFASSAQGGILLYLIYLIRHNFTLKNYVNEGLRGRVIQKLTKRIFCANCRKQYFLLVLFQDSEKNYRAVVCVSKIEHDYYEIGGDNLLELMQHKTKPRRVCHMTPLDVIFISRSMCFFIVFTILHFSSLALNVALNDDPFDARIALFITGVATIVTFVQSCFVFAAIRRVSVKDFALEEGQPVVELVEALPTADHAISGAESEKINTRTPTAVRVEIVY